MVYDSEGDRPRCEGREVSKIQVVWRARGHHHHGRRRAARRQAENRHRERGVGRGHRFFCPRDLPGAPATSYPTSNQPFFISSAPRHNQSDAPYAAKRKRQSQSQREPAPEHQYPPLPRPKTPSNFLNGSPTQNNVQPTAGGGSSISKGGNNFQGWK